MDKFFKTEAVVLSTTDFGDANRVVTFFTRNYGKIEANAYGCRRAKSSLSGAMQMFNHISLEFIKGIEINRVYEADIINFYNINDDLNKLAYASFFLELVKKMMPLEQIDENVFDLLLNSLKTFDKRNPRVAALTAACQFIANTGFQLSFKYCVECDKKITGDAKISVSKGGAICLDCCSNVIDAVDYPESVRKLFLKLLTFDWQDSTKFTLKAKDLTIAEDFFIKYIKSVLEAPLNSLNFLQMIKSIK